MLFLIEPGTLEEFLRKLGAARESEHIDDQLIHGIDRCGIRFVIEKMNEAVSYLHHIDMVSDRLGALR
jgi:hypothetical protein